ncbi:hypothetical protein ACLK2I_22330 [Escherichia coli]
MQYARAPVILLVVQHPYIVLDVWLVMGLHMNVQGAALANDCGICNIADWSANGA